MNKDHVDDLGTPMAKGPANSWSSETNQYIRMPSHRVPEKLFTRSFGRNSSQRTKWRRQPEQLISLPDDVSFDDAACLPVAYGTAHRMMLTRGDVTAGDSVLILGASGGVGTSALLLAKMCGASVIAAAGTDEKCEQLRALGADETINYSTTDFVKYCRENTGSLFSGGGYDVVVNFTGGDTWAKSLKCVKLGGRVLTCGATAGFDPPTDLRFIWTAEMDIRGSNGWQRSDLDELLRLTKTGEFSPVIDSRVPLEEGISAHRALEERKFFGKIVINADASI